jgi:hypothetical protein
VIVRIANVKRDVDVVAKKKMQIVIAATRKQNFCWQKRFCQQKQYSI